MGSGSACAPNFGCVRGTKPSFFTFARENSGVQPLPRATAMRARDGDEGDGNGDNVGDGEGDESA